MKIIHCPKGGKVPDGYCKKSCLNYETKHFQRVHQLDAKVRRRVSRAVKRTQNAHDTM
jgi:hypothetical protein